MPKKYAILTFCILTLLAISLSAQEVNVTGDWEMTITTPRGERTQDVNFEQEGEKLTVTMQGRRGEDDLHRKNRRRYDVGRGSNG
jgi:hypothetical protein